MSRHGSGDRLFFVVRNHEHQYSIWPAAEVLPEGWSAVGMERTKEECLGFVEQHWTDIRPLSARTSSSGPKPHT